MDSSGKTRTRRSCFTEDDEDVITSLANMEEGFSGNNNNNNNHYNQYSVSRHQFYSQRRSSFKNMASSFVSSPRSARFYDLRFEEPQTHFLEACFLCKKPLGCNRDIFMYRGDTPFCSEECRQEQIEIDETKDRRWNLSASMKALRKKEQRKSTSPSKAQDCPLHTSTIAAA